MGVLLFAIAEPVRPWSDETASDALLGLAVGGGVPLVLRSERLVYNVAGVPLNPGLFYFPVRGWLERRFEDEALGDLDGRASAFADEALRLGVRYPMLASKAAHRVEEYNVPSAAEKERCLGAIAAAKARRVEFDRFKDLYKALERYSARRVIRDLETDMARDARPRQKRR